MKQIFQKKPIAKLMQESKQKTLARTLGALDLTMLGIGAIVGTGIFCSNGRGSRRNILDQLLYYHLR